MLDFYGSQIDFHMWKQQKVFADVQRVPKISKSQNLSGKRKEKKKPH